MSPVSRWVRGGLQTSPALHSDRLTTGTKDRWTGGLEKTEGGRGNGREGGRVGRVKVRMDPCTTLSSGARSLTSCPSGSGPHVVSSSPRGRVGTSGRWSRRPCGQRRTPGTTGARTCLCLATHFPGGHRGPFPGRSTTVGSGEPGRALLGEYLRGISGPEGSATVPRPRRA